MSIFTLNRLLFDHFQFTLIYGPWFQVPMQYCSLQHQTLQCPHPQLGIVFSLALSLHSLWSYFSSLLQQHIGHLPAWGVNPSVSYLFAFSYCSWGSQWRILMWFAIPFSRVPCFVRTLHYDHPSWVALHSMAHTLSYMRLWSTWSVCSVLWDYGFYSVCPQCIKDKRLVEASWWEEWLWGKDGNCIHEIKRCLLSGRKAMANLNSIL